MNEQEYFRLSDDLKASKLKLLKSLPEQVDELFDKIRDEQIIDELNGRHDQLIILTDAAEAGEWHTDYDSWVADTEKRINELKRKLPKQPEQAAPKEKRK